MTSITVVTSPTLEPFADLWPTLDRAGEGAHFVFQTVEMLELWRRTIGAARRTEAFFMRVDVDDAPYMLLPLGIERRRGVRVLTFLDGGVSDYNAPVLFAHSAPPRAREIWRAVIDAAPAFDVAMLDKMPALTAGVVNPLTALAVGPAPPSGHVIPLVGAWSGFLAAQLHRPKDSRRKRRRLADAGAVRFLVAGSDADVDRIFPVFVAQKTRRYLDLNGSDGFNRPGYRSYFAAVTAQLHDRGVVHISALEVAGEILATHWGLVHGKRFYCLMLAYADHPLAQFSPARLLVENLIEWSYAQGLEAFDLGYGDAPWKRLLAAQAVPLAHAALPASALGWTYLQARKLRDSLAQPKAAEQSLSLTQAVTNRPSRAPRLDPPPSSKR